MAKSVFSGGLCLATVLIGFSLSAQGQSGKAALPAFDFKTITDAASWYSVDVGSLTPTPQGLSIENAGPDAYLVSPPRDFPGEQPLWLCLRLKSNQGGIVRVGCLNPESPATNVVEMEVPAGLWHEIKVAAPPLAGRSRLRLDPPVNGERCLLDRLWFEERSAVEISPFTMGADVLTIRSGALEFTQDSRAPGAFEVNVDGQLMAAGRIQPSIWSEINGMQQRWSFSQSAQNSFRVQRIEGGLQITSQSVDGAGAHWQMEQRLTPAQPGAIDIESRLTVDRDSMVACADLFTLHPGLHSFGTNKTQGLFCGLEYLENEPSSSEADVIGPEAQRQTPDGCKITFPLMAIAAQEHYVGLIWQPQTNLCALFDSPDRIFNAPGHVMGLVFPNSVRPRGGGALLARRGELFRSNQWLTCRATIIGGHGPTVVPAIKQYVALRGLPPEPRPGLSAQEYFKLAAQGWLQPALSTNGLFRHAISPDHLPGPAADAAVYMLWLAANIRDPELQTRLAKAAAEATQSLPDLGNCNEYCLAHIRTSLPALIFNEALANTRSAELHAQESLAEFQPDGTFLYVPKPGGLDYGRTHYASEANGRTASHVLPLLNWCMFSGNRSLLDRALHHLRAMDKFRNTVPRGSFPWMPLHAPELLAAADLVRCYTLGYQLTGDPGWLNQASYWAWSGLPFVYLAASPDGAADPYVTVIGFGAIDWVIPQFGSATQWAGLIYANALYELARNDSSGPWRAIANGITAKGIQHCWPIDEPTFGGLLPAIFQCRTQARRGAAINPGTLQICALRYYNQKQPYDIHAFRTSALIVYAPGELQDIRETSEGIAFKVQAWSKTPSSLLVMGLTNQPRVRINGQQTPLEPPHLYQSNPARLELHLQGPTQLEILCPAASSP